MVCHLTQADLAKRWRVGERTLELWRLEGTGPCYLKIGGRVLYMLKDIEDYENSRRFQQIGQPPVKRRKQ